MPQFQGHEWIVMLLLPSPTAAWSLPTSSSFLLHPSSHHILSSYILLFIVYFYFYFLFFFFNQISVVGYGSVGHHTQHTPASGRATSYSIPRRRHSVQQKKHPGKLEAPHHRWFECFQVAPGSPSVVSCQRIISAMFPAGRSEQT